MKNLIKNISTLCFIYIFTLQTSMAHVDSQSPVDETGAIDGVVDRNRAGYGWLNTTSEAEAEAFFNELCPQSGGAPLNPCLGDSSPLTAYYRLAGNNIEAAFTEMAKEKAYEYLALNQSAMGGPIPEIPSCLRDNPNVQKARRGIRQLGGYDDDQLEAHITRTNEQEQRLVQGGANGEDSTKLQKARYSKLMGIKLRAVRASYDNNRLTQAYLLEKQLSYHEDRTCPGTTQNGRLKCMSIRKNRERIRRAFPLIFDGGVMNILPDGFNILENRDNCGLNARQRFEQGVNGFLGAYGAPENVSSLSSSCDSSKLGHSASSTPACATTTEQKRIMCRGERNVNTHVRNEFGYPNLVSYNDRDNDDLPDGLLNQAQDALGMIGDPDEGPEEFEATRLQNGQDAIDAAITDMKTNEKQNNISAVNALCNDRTNLRSLLTRYPHVMRQAVLDMDDSGSRDAVKGLLCSRGLMERYQRNSQSNSCQGITVRPSGTVHVERTAFGFPYRSDSNYDIEPQADGSYVLKSKLNYQFQCDPSLVPNSHGHTTVTQDQLLAFSDTNGNGTIDADEFDYHQMIGNCAHQRSKFTEISARWVQQAQSAVTASAANIKTPKVRFEITQCDATCPANQEPLITVSACYNHASGSHNCATAGSNWQDAGGYSLNTGADVIAHETGHALGLADEYTADYYPAHAIGEYGAVACNSTMGSTNATCHKYYPRHFSEMVRPAQLNCANGGTGPADRQ